MAILPTRLLEIELTPGSGTWTDLFADVVSIQTQRGKNRELGAYETGHMTVTLRNETRKYDPEYAAGAYYGNLRPMRRIRFRAQIAGVYIPIFQGYVDRITQNYDGPNGAVTTITASDMFKILNRIQLPRSVYTVEVNTDAPELWYRLDEPNTTTFLMNSGSLGRSYDASAITAGGTTPVLGLGNQGLIVRDGGTAGYADGANANLAGLIPNDYQLTDARPFAIEAWVNITTPTSLMEIYHQPGLGASGESIRFIIQNTGKPGIIVYNTAGTAYGVETTSALAAGVHHLVARHDSDRTLHIFVDGVDQTIADLGVPGTTTGTIAKTPGASYMTWSGGAGLGSGVIDELAIYTTGGSVALSTARIQAHNSAGRTPWNGDTAGARFQRIIALSNFVAGDYTLGTAPTTLEATSLDTTVLAYLQKLEQTELGAIFVSKDGKVTFRGRQELQTGGYLTSQATLTDAPASLGEVPYLDGFPIYDVDESMIIDQATVSRDGSIAVTYQDASAITEFQIVSATYDGLLHDSDAYSYDYAQWIVNTHRTPTTRIGAVTVDLTIDPALNVANTVLALELAARTTLRRRPKVGSAISYDYRVEAISHDTGGAYWKTTLQLSPFNLGAGGNPVWVWGTTKWGSQVWGI